MEVPMLLSVKDVLKIGLLKNCNILTAKASLDKQHVESISVIEIPVDNFVRKNEFVLSTAIGCGQDPTLFLEFVNDIINSGAAALAIAIGHYVKEIPKEVLELAENRQFPIIEVPWDLRFSDIIQAVYTTINNWHSLSLKRSEEMQKELLHLFLKKGDLSQAAEIMHKKIGRPIITIDREGSLLGRSKNTASLIQLWEKASSSPLSFHPINSNSYLNSNVKWTEFEKEIFIQVSIRSAHLIQGYLLLTLPQNTQLNTFLTNDIELILEHAATSSALWFQRENTIKETEMRLRDDFVWSLTKDKGESWDIKTSRSKLLGFDLTLPYVCIIGQPENNDLVFQASIIKDLQYEFWLQNLVRELEEKMIQAGKVLERKVMITYQQDKFIVYLEMLDYKLNQSVHTFLDLIEVKIKEMHPKLLMSWGIGEYHEGNENFNRSYKEAKIALEIGSKQKGPGHRNTYVSTGIYRVLQCLLKHDEIYPIVQSTLRIIVEYDKEKGLDLIRTLMVHIRNRYIVSQTARELNLHRQSLLYRLEKIETLTGLSLSDPDDLFLLDLSIKLWSTDDFHKNNGDN
jgi:purine catabolism regulator